MTCDLITFYFETCLNQQVLKGVKTSVDIPYNEIFVIISNDTVFHFWFRTSHTDTYGFEDVINTSITIIEGLHPYDVHTFSLKNRENVGS